MEWCEKEVQECIVFPTPPEVVPVAAETSPGTSSGSDDLELEDPPPPPREMPNKEKKSPATKKSKTGKTKPKKSEGGEIKKLKTFKKTVLAAVLSLNK
jgi:hypothetical protein